MKTQIFDLKKNPEHRHKALRQSAAILRRGGLVAFPTETVYGLGANALDATAVRKIFRVKKRPADNPLIIHIGYKKDLYRYARKVPGVALRLIRQFWPGPLTLILPKKDCIPDIVSGGLPTLAVRMPSHPTALALIRRAGVPVAAPSANRSGKPSPTTAAHVLEDLSGQIDLVLDEGPTQVGLESTVLDLTTYPPVILRPGRITAKQIRACIGTVIADTSAASELAIQPKSPGLKYKHYAPDAPLTLVCGEPVPVYNFIQRQIRPHQGEKTGVLTIRKKHGYRHAQVIYIGSKPDTIARNLFAAFREMNRRSVDRIFAECPPEIHFDEALMNRLRKAAANQIIKVK